MNGGEQIVIPPDAPSWAIAMVVQLTAIIAELRARIYDLENP